MKSLICAIIEKNFYLSGDELNSEIRNIQAIETIKIILKFLKKYPNFKRKNQSGKSTFCRRRFASDSKLNINKTLKKNFNLLRIADNDRYPAYFEYKETHMLLKFLKNRNKSLIIKIYDKKKKMKNKYLSSIKIIDQISNIRKKIIRIGWTY